ncbi:MAG: hypothetical protein DHS20C21_09670 [Gemmatimonadota bacterium]|nr:MAG: hypothetical protein DHS20C21_09670 [Gemmatimonadota bacterium]
MSIVTRKIGLSLGADICWPIAYEEILKLLDLSIPMDGDSVTFEVERVTIEPFDLRQANPYDVVIDRLTHWYTSRREWIKKAVLMDGVYVFNNPWSIQSMEKQTSYCAMMRLGLPIPETWLVPPKEYEQTPDLKPTLERYARMFNLDEIGDRLGYPMYMKPYDGGGWVGVSRIDDAAALKAAYEQSGRHVMHLQRAVDPHDLFVRSVGLGPQVRTVLYDPGAPLHDRYTMETDFMDADDRALLLDMVLTINSFFGWDFNSCEALRGEAGVWYPIDFANPCPDSQVTSLHYHFPWLIKASLRWSLFNAAVRRQRALNLNWAPYYKIADTDRSYREKLAAYAAIAHDVMETDRFEEFCQTHLSHLDEVADQWFATDTAKEAVRKKVTALYPEDEIEEFTELFWERIQQYRKDEPPGAPGTTRVAVPRSSTVTT